MIPYIGPLAPNSLQGRRLQGGSQQQSQLSRGSRTRSGPRSPHCPPGGQGGYIVVKAVILKVVKKYHINMIYIYIYDNWMFKYNVDGQTSEKSTSMKQGMNVAFATITRKSHNLSGSSSRPALWQNNAYSNLKPKFSFWFCVLLYCEVGKPEVSQRSWLGNRAMQSQQRQDLNTNSSSQQNLFVFINIYDIKV